MGSKQSGAPSGAYFGHTRRSLCRTHEERVNLNADRRALASAAVEQLSPELILLWWVNRELDGAMIDLSAAISGGMKRT
jgi:hypothetical protein